MRLLKIYDVKDDHVEFELVTRKGNPDYAILSHTWGDDSDELSFEDMERRSGHDKPGYEKVRGFLAKAWQDGFRYGWVDTCCIDKKSSAELSEAINSMFQWYHGAKRCFVYLSDFEDHLAKLPKNKLQEALRSCKWFTRGWTLQELLAPKDLIFYSKHWQSIGDGEYLKDIIATITGIHEEALTGITNDFSNFSIAQRMSWASKRKTTRPEDIAYCLMGIFDVNMPLLYGEGNKAFTRLQEQIIKDSDDQTIFCWVREYRPGDTDQMTASFLASSPRDFQGSSNYVPAVTSKVHPYEITNAGLRITGRLQDRGDSWRLLLPCYEKTMPHTFVKLPLNRIGHDGDQFSRIPSLINRDHNDKHPEKTIYIKKKAALHRPPLALGHRVSVSISTDVSLADELYVEEVYPSEYWTPTTSLIQPTGIDSNSESLTNFSWHAAVKMRVSISIYVIAIIGYNGRENKAWCQLQASQGQVDLKSFWNLYGFTNARRESETSLSVSTPATARSPSQLWALQASMRKTRQSGLIASSEHTLTFDKQLIPYPSTEDREYVPLPTTGRFA